MDNELETIDSPNDDQTDVEVLDVSTEEQDIETVRTQAKALEEQAKKLAEQNKQLFARAKKAEGFVIKDGKWVKHEPEPEAQTESKSSPKSEAGDITARDTIAIMRANIHEDDIGEVVEYAKFKGISVAEALKQNVILATLRDKTEQRQTADATSTGRVRSGSARMSGDHLLEKAQATGEIPESDEGMKALVESRFKK